MKVNLYLLPNPYQNVQALLEPQLIYLQGRLK